LSILNSQASKKDLIVKSLECLIDHHLQTHIAKHQVHNLQATTIEDQLWQVQMYLLYKRVVPLHYKRGSIGEVRSANKEKDLCHTLHETCGNEALGFLTNKVISMA
jgi:hypothetical protein